MKKKNILIGLTLISALSFAQGQESNGNNQMRSTECLPTQNRMVTVKHSNNNMHRQIIVQKTGKSINLPKELKLELDKKRIRIQELNLSVKRMLLEEKVDWNKVKETNKNIALLKADIRTSVQKFRHTQGNK
ncbi:hypothetical protein [Fusobacterium sp. MFO224]|uniref:hypothetical protein n=1 Tax=Fusobacterium sp. MFO224 TaxID=3378070 RepID=UPI003853E0DA